MAGDFVKVFWHVLTSHNRSYLPTQAKVNINTSSTLNPATIRLAYVIALCGSFFKPAQSFNMVQ